MRIAQPLALAARTTSATRSLEPMLPTIQAGGAGIAALLRKRALVVAERRRSAALRRRGRSRAAPPCWPRRGRRRGSGRPCSRSGERRWSRWRRWSGCWSWSDRDRRVAAHRHAANHDLPAVAAHEDARVRLMTWSHRAGLPRGNRCEIVAPVRHDPTRRSLAWKAECSIRRCLRNGDALAAELARLAYWRFRGRSRTADRRWPRMACAKSRCFTMPASTARASPRWTAGTAQVRVSRHPARFSAEGSRQRCPGLAARLVGGGSSPARGFARAWLGTGPEPGLAAQVAQWLAQRGPARRWLPATAWAPRGDVVRRSMRGPSWSASLALVRRPISPRALPGEARRHVDRQT